MNCVRRSIAVAGAVALAVTVLIMAQNLSFGADNFYQSDIVNVVPITLLNQYQMTAAGNLFICNNLSRSKNALAIIVRHLIGAVKE